MAKLTHEVQVFIVSKLACFLTPTEVAEAVKEEFDVTVSRQHVRSYNPEQGNNAKRWRKIFDETRKKYLSDVSDVGIAHQAHRVREYQQTLRLARKNPAMRLAVLKGVAEELGGAYTNKKTVQLEGLDFGALTDRELERIAAGEDAVAVLRERGKR